MIAKSDDMLRPEPTSDEHTDTKTNGLKNQILPSHHDSGEAPDKPKNRHRGRKSFRHKCGESDDKSIIEIVPNSRSSNEHIPENIEKTAVLNEYNHL